MPHAINPAMMYMKGFRVWRTDRADRSHLAWHANAFTEEHFGVWQALRMLSLVAVVALSAAGGEAGGAAAGLQGGVGRDDLVPLEQRPLGGPGGDVEVGERRGSGLGGSRRGLGGSGRGLGGSGRGLGGSGRGLGQGAADTGRPVAGRAGAGGGGALLGVAIKEQLQR